MIEKWMRLVCGTATVRVQGDTSRFLSVMVRSGITPLEMTAGEEEIRLVIRARQYKQLHAVKRRTGARVKLLEKRGLPFVLRRVSHRPGMTVGLILGICLYLWLSGFYWCVDIKGEAPYSTAEILSAAQRCGVFVGAKQEKVDLQVAAKQLMQALPEIAWVSFNSEGCAVTVEYRSGQARDTGVDKTGAYDIVASRDGLVRSITAQSGTVLVKTGSAVLEGQVLVTGVTVIGDPWDPTQEVKHILSHARAEVIAETRHVFSASCPLKSESLREVETGVRRELYVLGLRIPLSLQGTREGEIENIARAQAELFGQKLPLWVDTQRCGVYETVEVTFTEEEAARRAAEEVRLLQENYLGEHGRVLQEERAVSVRDGKVYVTAHCIVEENIAREVAMSGA